MATVESSRLTTARTSSAAAISATATESHAAVGRVGPWQLARLLGEGNLTRVYLARPADTPLGQRSAYAIKLLRKEWWREPAAIEVQRREAWVGSQVSHPNLLPVLSASVRQPPFYVVTPKLEGMSLAQILTERGRLDIPLSLWIARQVADGLTALHEATGMVHTDVKPANIFISSTGHATLLDFGFAQSPAEGRHWSTRPLAGTLAYMAPEMITSALAVESRSDIYSLGVTLYEMLTGHRPFETDDPGELATLHREAKPIHLRKWRSDAGAEIATLVHSMLAKDPMRRPASAKELADRLVRLEIDSFALVAA